MFFYNNFRVLCDLLLATLILMCGEVVGQAARLVSPCGGEPRLSWTVADSAGVGWTVVDGIAQGWIAAAADGFEATAGRQMPRAKLVCGTEGQSWTGMESCGAVWIPLESGGHPWTGVDTDGGAPTPDGQKWPREVAFKCLSLPSTLHSTPRASGNGRHRVGAHRHAQATPALTPAPSPTDTGCHETPVPIDDSQISATGRKSGRKMVKPAIAVSTTKQHNEKSIVKSNHVRRAE